MNEVCELNVIAVSVCNVAILPKFVDTETHFGAGCFDAIRRLSICGLQHAEWNCENRRHTQEGCHCNGNLNELTVFGGGLGGGIALK